MSGNKVSHHFQDFPSGETASFYACLKKMERPPSIDGLPEHIDQIVRRSPARRVVYAVAMPRVCLVIHAKRWRHQ